MQIAVENLEGLKRRMVVTVPAAEIEKKYQDRLRSVGKTAKIKGFRPGKVPVDVLEKQFGQSVLMEVAGEMIQTTLGEALQEKDLNPAGMPDVTPKEIKKGDALEYEAAFEVFPEVTLKDFSKAKVETVTSEVTDKDIDDVLERVRDQHADWAEVDRAAKTGDRLTFDFEGSIDGELFEGGAAKDFQLELGSGQMIPGFEEGLENTKAGQELDINVTFPEQYPAEQLAGKPSVFKIKVHKVMEPKLPEVNDALAEKVGVEGGIDALRADVRKHLTTELERAVKQRSKEAVLDELLKLNPITVPAALIDQEIKHLQQMTLNQMAAQNGGQEVPKIDLPREPYVEQAEKRVSLGLLLGEVIKTNDLKADADKVKARIEEIASTYPKPEEVTNWYYQNPKMLTEIEAVVLEDQVVEKLLEVASVKEKTLGFQELMNPNQDKDKQ